MRRSPRVRTCRPPSATLVLLALVSALAAVPARASTVQVDIERFRPAPDGHAGFATPATSVLPLGEFALGLVLHDAYRPLVLQRENGQRTTLVENRLAGAVTGVLGVGGPVAVGLSIPVIFFQGGSLGALPRGQARDGELAVAGFGDLLVSPRISLLRQKENGLDLALEAGLTLPTGQSEALLGDGSLGGSVAANLGYALGPVSLLAQGGMRFRAFKPVLRTEVGNELLLRTAAVLRLPYTDALLLPRELIAEVDFATLAARPFEAATTPGEWRVGARFCAFDRLAITVGGGTGLTGAYGTPVARGLLSAGWEPRACGAPDRDRDGIPDASDACPDQPGVAEHKGCARPAVTPPRDADRDGIPDAEDRCPEQPGTRAHGGCPAPVGFGDDDLDALPPPCPTAPGSPATAGCPPVPQAPVPQGSVPQPPVAPLAQPPVPQAPVDSDGDGVLDAADRCPTVPGPARHGGCPPPADRDGDGVPDSADRCPDKPGTPELAGCPTLDSDGDGVEDGIDRCPSEPGAAESFGCPRRDQDSDGVPDHEDTCLFTQGTARNAGCPAKQKLLVVLRGSALELRAPVMFREGRPLLERTSHALLDQLAKVISEHAELPRIRVEAHVEPGGNPAEEQRLSQLRAETVVDQLIARGVPADRLEAAGLGGERPAAPGAPGRGLNERVEVRIVGRLPTGVPIRPPVLPVDLLPDLEIEPLVPPSPPGAKAPAPPAAAPLPPVTPAAPVAPVSAPTAPTAATAAPTAEAAPSPARDDASASTPVELGDLPLDELPLLPE